MCVTSKHVLHYVFMRTIEIIATQITANEGINWTLIKYNLSTFIKIHLQ